MTRIGAPSTVAARQRVPEHERGSTRWCKQAVRDADVVAPCRRGGRRAGGGVRAAPDRPGLRRVHDARPSASIVSAASTPSTERCRMGAREPHRHVGGPATEVDGTEGLALATRKSVDELVDESLMRLAEVGLAVRPGLLDVVHELGLGNACPQLHRDQARGPLAPGHRHCACDYRHASCRRAASAGGPPRP